MSGEERSVTFHYIKSNHFRAIHSDGGIGGLTPSGLIHLSIYNERPALPQQAVHKIDNNGHVSDSPEKVVTKNGIVREVEADILMNLQTARGLRDWLSLNIDALEKQIESES